MNTTNTWHDIADRLTPAQREQFAAVEAANPGPGDRAWMAVEARELAARNVADAERFGHLPAPAGAVTVERADLDRDGRWARQFTGAGHAVAGVHVGIEGVQLDTGEVRRWLSVAVDRPGEDTAHPLPVQARELAAALMDCADEIERLSGVSPETAARPLRSRLARVDPANMTHDDVEALLDVLRRRFEAAEA